MRGNRLVFAATALALVPFGADPQQPRQELHMNQGPSAPAPAKASTVHRSRRVAVITDFGAVADGKTLNTRAIQSALNRCGELGGGTVRVPAGVFLSGGLTLRSNVALRLDKGAVLQGSTDCRDYGGKSLWTDALLKGADLENVRIEGEGTLDGADCRNPKGEEGFRGPHAVSLHRCRNTVIRDITIARSANWAFNCTECSGARIERLKVRGGHDGFDASESSGCTFRNCDFRTGDDCIAGAGNRDFVVTGCTFNTSCNGFRFACIGLTVRDCRFFGPGEYIHKISKRTNMLTAFVHFSPTDRGYHGSVPHSDRWLIEKCSAENVDALYEYNHRDGGWQTGRPVKAVKFRGITATGLVIPIRLIGDTARQLDFAMERADLAFADRAAHQPLIDASRFGSLTLRQVILRNDGHVPVLRAADGDRLVLESVRSVPEGNVCPFVVERVGKVDVRRSSVATGDS